MKPKDNPQTLNNIYYSAFWELCKELTAETWEVLREIKRDSLDSSASNL